MSLLGIESSISPDVSSNCLILYNCFIQTREPCPGITHSMPSATAFSNSHNGNEGKEQYESQTTYLVTGANRGDSHHLRRIYG